MKVGDDAGEVPILRASVSIQKQTFLETFGMPWS